MANVNDVVLAWQDPNDRHWEILTFDGVLEEALSGEAIITKYPVDEGFEVSTHAIRRNRMISLKVLLSKITLVSSSTVAGTFEHSFAAILAALGESGDWSAAQKYGPAGSTGNSVDAEKTNRAIRAINQLNGTGTRVHVLGVRGVYENCVITSFVDRYSGGNTFGSALDLQLEQLTVIEGMQPTGQGLILPVASSAPYETFQVPFSAQQSTQFAYKGADYVISPLVTRASGRLSFDLEYSAEDTGVAYGIVALAGANLVAGRGTGLPSLVANNTVTPGTSPTSVDNLELLIIEDYAAYLEALP